MSNDLRDFFKKELDQIPLRSAETWVPERRRISTLPRLAWRAPLAVVGAIVVLVAAAIAGQQLASFRSQTAVSLGVVAGKAIYLSPSFNGSGWIQIDPITLQDVASKPLMDIPPTNANTDDTMISADGSTIVVGEFTTAGARRAVYDGSTGQLRGYLTPEVPMVIESLSADGRTALGRLRSTADAITGPKVIISVEDGHVIRTIPAGPPLWTEGILIAPDLSAIYYIVTSVPLAENLDNSVMQPLSLVVRTTTDGNLSAPFALPGMTMGTLLNASPVKSVAASAALSPDGRQLALVSSDGATLSLVDTSSLRVTTRSVHRKTSLWDWFGPLVADAKQLADQQWVDVRFTPDGTALLVAVTDIHYGSEVAAQSPVRTTRGIRRIELATGEITADVSPTGGIYSIELSSDGAGLYLVVRTQEPPSAAYVLRRLDARNLELRTERALSDYAELKLVAAPALRR